MKLTRWFASDTDGPPVRRGVYRVMVASREPKVFKYWNKNYWGPMHYDVRSAFQNREEIGYPPAYWCGLTTRPR